MRTPLVFTDTDLENKYYSKQTIKYSKLFSLWFKPENIDRLSLKGRLPPRYIEFLKNTWAILDRVYPGKGDIQFELEPTFKTITNTYGSNHARVLNIFEKFQIKKMFIVIHFPNLEITNSKKDTINIKDLFVRIPITVNYGTRGKLFFERIQGVRTTISPIEYKSFYSHSHLREIDFSESAGKALVWDNFCVGNADVMNTCSLLNSAVDFDLIELALIQIETFVKWESLEGGPYISMRNVVDANTDVFRNISISSARDFYRSITLKIKEGFKINFDWKLVDGKYQIIDNEKFEQNILEVALSCFSSNTFYGYKDEKGEFYRHNPLPLNIIKKYDSWIPFRGEKVYFEVKGELKKSKNTDTRYLNPKIKAYVKARLEYQANYASIRESRIAKLSQGHNT